MADLPNVTVAPTTDGGLVGFVHAGMKVRTIFADTLDRIRDRLPSVLVAEFGMTQDEANNHGITADTGAVTTAMAQEAHQQSAAAAAQANDHVGLLQEQLAELQAELEVERATSADLKARLAAATAHRTQPPPQETA